MASIDTGSLQGIWESGMAAGGNGGDGGGSVGDAEWSGIENDVLAGDSTRLDIINSTAQEESPPPLREDAGGSSESLDNDSDTEDDSLRFKLMSEIERLELLRDECTARKEYEQAARHEERINVVKKGIEYTIASSLEARQVREQKRQDKVRQRAFAEFQVLWKDRMELFDARAASLLGALADRQAAELENFWATEKEAPLRPKFSATIIQRRNIEAKLAKARQFERAAVVRREADELEAKELAQFHAARALTLKRKEDVLLSAHAAEVAALKLKLEKVQAEGILRQEADYERLVKQFKNMKLDLRTDQVSEVAQTQRYVHTFSSPSPHNARVAPNSVYDAPRPVAKTTPRSWAHSVDTHDPHLYPNLSGAGMSPRSVSAHGHLVRSPRKVSGRDVSDKTRAASMSSFLLSSRNNYVKEHR